MTRHTAEFQGLSHHGFHRIVYQDWGNRENPNGVICVHGLTRNSRDFDPLAKALAADFRVVCPDMPGRGQSQWLSDPADYSYPTYLNNMAALLARVDLDQVNWIGTSMGGLIGIMLAAQPGSPIGRLILNDIGPFLPKDALQRLAEYVGADPQFKTLDDVEKYLRQIHAPFGALTDSQWKHLAQHSSRSDPAGGYRLHYDPAISHAFKAKPIEDVDLWPIWSQITCPVLLLHGETSDLLTSETIVKMKEIKPDLEVVEIVGTGHAPILMSEFEIQLISHWLKSTPAIANCDV